VIRYHISLFILVLIACVLQQFIPAVTALFDARILLLHLVFLCGAVTVGFSPMLGLAFLAGFLWDANNTLGPQGVTLRSINIRPKHYALATPFYSLA